MHEELVKKRVKHLEYTNRTSPPKPKMKKPTLVKEHAHFKQKREQQGRRDSVQHKSKKGRRKGKRQNRRQNRSRSSEEEDDLYSDGFQEEEVYEEEAEELVEEEEEEEE
jgi:hypothetical protein